MAASSNQHIGQAVFANRNMWSGILFGILFGIGLALVWLPL